MSAPPESQTGDTGSAAPAPVRRRALITGGLAVLSIAAAGVPDTARSLRRPPRPSASPVNIIAALNPPSYIDAGDPYENAQAVAFSPDGRTLAVGHESGTVRFWDVRTRRPVRSMRGSPWIVCLAFSPDGRTLACGSGDDTDPPTHLWDLTTGEHTSLPDSGWVTFSPDGRLLAVAGGGDRLWLWRMPHRRRIATLHVPERTDFVAFSPDGRTLACGGGEFGHVTMQLWKVATRTRKRTFVPREGKEAVGRIVALSYDPADRPLAFDDSGGVWDIAAGTRRATLPVADFLSGVEAPALSPDGRTVVTVSGKAVQFVDLETGRPLAPWYRRTSIFSGWKAAFSPDGTLAAVTNGPQILLFRLSRRS